MTTKLRIQPQSVLLTSGQAATFHAFEGEAAVKASWRFDVAPDLPAAELPTPQLSGIYIAPVVTQARNVVVIAERGEDRVTAQITLTPDAVAIVPAEAQLMGDDVQDFIAIIAGVPEAEVTWILSPPVGALEPVSKHAVRYRAPKEFEDDVSIKVLATTHFSKTPAEALVKLTSPPWTGPGVQLLGGFLLLVFCLVFLLIALWPPALPSPDAARADRVAAERQVDDKTHLLDAAELALATATDEAKAKEDAKAKEEAKAKEDAKVETKGSPGAETPPASAVSIPASAPSSSAKVQALKNGFERANAARATALQELQAKQAVEAEVNSPNVSTRLVACINREIDLLWLVLCAGGLGGFLHMAQSYGEYIGNRTLKSRWAWWYGFRPFIGAALAVVVYAAVRGGFMAIATGSNTKAAELNPFGLVSVAALVGMFSRSATIKLGEVFDTLFKSDKSKTADKLVNPATTDTAAASKTTPAVPVK